MIQLRKITLDDKDYPNKVMHSSIFSPEVAKENKQKIELQHLWCILFSDDTEYANQDLGYRSPSSMDLVDSDEWLQSQKILVKYEGSDG